MSIQNSQIDYSHTSMPVKPSYRYSKVFAQSGQSATISTAPFELLFELPARCMNLSRSSVRYISTPTDPGATVKHNWMFNDLIACCRQAQLYTRGGLVIADNTIADRYSQITLKEKMRDETVIYEPEANDIFGSIADGSTLNPRYDAATDYKTIAGEPQYYTRGTDSEAEPVQERVLSIGDFGGSIFGMDKNLYFNEVVILKLVLNDRDAWGHIGSSATNPATGAAVLTGNVVLAGITLHLALESDPVICAGLHAKVNSAEGLSMVIPYTYAFKNTDAAATTARVVSIKLGRIHGRHLQKVYYVPYHATESASTRYNHNSAVVTSYYTAVDNSRRQEYDVTLANGDDWLEIKDKVKGSIVSGSRDRYRYNWYVLDKFDGDVGDNVNMVVDSGLPLDIERKLDLTLNSASIAYNMYTFAVVTRLLTVTAQGIMLS